MTDPALLTTDAMVDFAQDGFLRFEALIPDAVNRAFLETYVAGEADERAMKARLPAIPVQTPLATAFPAGSPLAAVVAHPVVAGAVSSLLGPDPVVDHQVVHYRGPHQGTSQHLHCDAMFDARRDAFDIQIMYFPQDVSRDMGGTLVVPGSHTRRVGEATIARYQNVRGQTRLIGPAGTVLVLHHNLWHAGRRNASDRPRVMWKLRLNPTVRQSGHWDMRDYDPAAARAAKPLHSPYQASDDVQGRLAAWQPWADCRGGHLDIVQKTRLWRLLSGDEDFTAHHWLDRVENRPAE